jgi:hypothetical protein
MPLGLLERFTDRRQLLWSDVSPVRAQSARGLERGEVVL